MLNEIECFPATWGKVKHTEKAEVVHWQCDPSIHSTDCDRIGSIWALRVHSLGFSKEQELYKAVVSDNWNIPSAQEAQLQMIDGGCMCPRELFLPFPEYVCESSMSWILTQCPERKQRQASVSLQANLKLRWMAETGEINQSALYFSITCPAK